MSNIKALKKYGQNFLKSEEILKNISSLVSPNNNDLIIEIGPGLGALTKYLKQKNSFLLAYEIDERMRPFLENLEDNKTKIIFDDFLKRNIEKDFVKKYLDIYVVANIPYYITTPILMKLINNYLPIKTIVLLVQKEFADRLSTDAGHKDYNALTLYVDYYYQVSKEFIVSRNNFTPIPNVDSAVIKLERKDEKRIVGEEEYFNFIREAFKSKRKTLKNNLSNYKWEIILIILKELGFKENVRAEEISKEKFKLLWTKYYNIINSL